MYGTPSPLILSFTSERDEQLLIAKANAKIINIFFMQLIKHTLIKKKIIKFFF